MAVSRNDLCPCGSGKKFKKCCLGAPDPTAERKSKIVLWSALALLVVTVAAFYVAGQGVGAAVGMGSFALVLGYALAGGSGGAGSEKAEKTAASVKTASKTRKRAA